MTKAPNHPPSPETAIARGCVERGARMRAGRPAEKALPEDNANGHVLGETQVLVTCLQTIASNIMQLERYVERDLDCADVLELSFRVQRELRSIDTMIIQRHLETHLMSRFDPSNAEDEIAALLRLYRAMPCEADIAREGPPGKSAS